MIRLSFHELAVNGAVFYDIFCLVFESGKIFKFFEGVKFIVYLLLRSLGKKFEQIVF